MKRLGVFGGSFDPPHLAHTLVARAALDQLSLDAVLWVPAGRPPHKTNRTLTDDHHRCAMIAGVIANEPRFRLDTRELDRKGLSWSVQTLESIAEEFPDAELYLIVGEDNYASFHTWRNPERIRELAEVVVYRRPDMDTASGDVTWLDGITSDISSTDIRQLLQSDGQAGDLLHPETRDYIRSHGLYLGA